MEVMPVDNSSASSAVDIPNTPFNTEYSYLEFDKRNPYSWLNTFKDAAFGSNITEKQMQDYINRSNDNIDANIQLMRDIYAMNLSNEFSAAEAQKSRDFTERMSNTSYQRAVEDMQKAGINPVLAYSQGGASTPSSATASSSGAGSAGNRSRYGSTDSKSSGFMELLSDMFGLIGGFLK